MRLLAGLIGMMIVASASASAADRAAVAQPATQSAEHRIDEVIVTAPRDRTRPTLQEEMRYHDEVLAELRAKVIVAPERDRLESAFDFDGNTTKLLKVRF